MTGSKSISMTWSRSSHDSKPTCPMTVDDHHEPGKCAAPFAHRNRRTGSASSSRAVSAGSQRLPLPRPVCHHELQEKPEIGAPPKLHRSDSHRPARRQ